MTSKKLTPAQTLEEWDRRYGVRSSPFADQLEEIRSQLAAENPHPDATATTSAPDDSVEGVA